MDEWIDVDAADALAPGQCQVVEDGTVAVINLGGRFYAIDNICTHDYAELCEGRIIGEEIQCPLHGAQFNIKTGAVTQPPAYEPLRTYEVRIQDGRVQVKVPQ